MAEVEFGKKLNNYREDVDNYVADKELTVLITLNEYRNLVSLKSAYEREMGHLRDTLTEREQQLSDLREQIKDTMKKYEREDDGK